MNFNFDDTQVQEINSNEYEKRFMCVSDMQQYSVELVIQVDEDDTLGVLTVWNDQDLITNDKVIDVDLDNATEESASDFFEDFLMGDINNYLKKRR